MKTKLFISIIIISATILFAGVNLYRFTGRSQDGNVIIEWQTLSETNVDHFVVERASYNGTFMDLGTVSPNSSMSYSYTDRSVFKVSDQLYLYKIKVVDKDGSISESSTIAVPHSVSGVVKRTWGSIKALFR
jgi:hypothetical protein